jgi:hypothetical protein
MNVGFDAAEKLESPMPFPMKMHPDPAKVIRQPQQLAVSGSVCINCFPRVADALLSITPFERHHGKIIECIAFKRSNPVNAGSPEGLLMKTAGLREIALLSTKVRQGRIRKSFELALIRLF